MLIRELERHEVEQVWSIDRREVIENIYSLKDGMLILHPEFYDMQGWPPGESELYAPILLDCFDRGGTFFGAFEGQELIGVSVLESKLIGKHKDQLQLKFMQVSNRRRKQGLGKLLFLKTVEKARELNARRLYISATPSENTVNFYMQMGCTLAEEIDPELFELEPEDIHMEYRIPPSP
jgi:predicted N-acetyltransferase YhbS